MCAPVLCAHIVQKKEAFRQQRKASLFTMNLLLFYYYRRQLTRAGVDYLLNALNGHVFLLRKLLEGHTVKQLALEYRAVALREYPLVNERAPLCTAKAVLINVECGSSLRPKNQKQLHHPRRLQVQASVCTRGNVSLETGNTAHRARSMPKILCCTRQLRAT